MWDEGDLLDAVADAALAEARAVWAAEDARQEATKAASDLDHARSWRDGGATSAANLGTLHRRHHRAKSHHGWRIEPMAPDGSVTFTSPHGLRHRRPPTAVLDGSLPEPPPPPPAPEPAPEPAPDPGPPF